MHGDFFRKKVFFFFFFLGKNMIDLIFFRKGDKAWPNAPSLENECMILKIFELVNFLFSLLSFFFFLKQMMMMMIFL